MITLEQILKAEFEKPDVDKIIQILASHSLYSPVINSIEVINNQVLKSQSEIQTDSVFRLSHIACSLLIRTNEYLRILKSQQKNTEVSEIEFYLGSILKRLLIILTGMFSDKQKKVFFESLGSAVETTCFIFGYNFNELLILLSVDDLVSERNIINNTPDVIVNSEKSTQMSCFVWRNCDVEEFQTFIEIVSGLNIIPDIEKFRALFHNPSTYLSITLDESRITYVLQFFAWLKESKFISSQGGGFYQVLQTHVVHFDTVFLNNRPAKRRIDTVKNIKSWPINCNEFERLFKFND